MRSLLACWLLLAALACATGCGPEAGGDTARLLEEGWRAYSAGDFDFAESSFRSAVRSEAATERQLFSAHLGLATTCHLGTSPDLQTARQHYEWLQQSDAPAARRLGLLGLAQIELQQQQNDAARKRLDTIREEFSDTAEADEATLHLAQSYFEPPANESMPGGYELADAESVETGLQLLIDWLGRRPENRLAAVMHQTVADKLIERQDYRVAVEHLRAALARGIVSARTRSSILWQIARIAEYELGDLALAEDYYERFVAVSRRHVLYYRATQSLQRVRRLRAEVAGGQEP